MQRILLAVLAFFFGIVTMYVLMPGDDEQETIARIRSGIAVETSEGRLDSSSLQEEGQTPSVSSRSTARQDEQVSQENLSQGTARNSSERRDIVNTSPTAREDAAVSDDERTDRPRSEADGNAERGSRPVPLIADIQLQGDMALYHDRLESEAEDVAWSSVTELELSSYFASKPRLAENFALPLVECRETLCEIQAIGYGPDALENWQAQTSDIGEHNEQFIEFRVTGEQLGPNEHAIVLIGARMPPDSTSQSVEPGDKAS